ncbi:MAG: ABC transporter substrate-binding protein [Betaproteobacteria bacterium]|jgi:ABC-type transport system substrate-binding protein|nr:ABC transporter substrate-binding protein [Rhodocyclaceae bacterium]
MHCAISSTALATVRLFAVCGAGLLLGGCDHPWNDPYPPAERTSNTLYSSFTERPKHLDPVQSYSSNEIVFTAQVYTPPLQYHYLRRPFELTPFAAAALPEVRYLDAHGRQLENGAPAERVAFSVYEVKLRPDLRYQPHPAFALGTDGTPRYVPIDAAEAGRLRSPMELAEHGTRAVRAEDFVYQIKRLAHPKLHSPIFGLMSDYIVGLKEYGDTLKRAQEELDRTAGRGAWLDLRRFPLEGVEVVDESTYRVKLKGRYPQFIYWLAMPFFAPLPFEAERFYAQPALSARNVTLDWFPVGAGPYMLVINDPNRRMVLERNPNFFGESYPADGEPADAEAGLLADAGKPIPFIDRAVFSLEKEAIPYWNKFLQGWYDASGITSDAFDQAVQVGSGGQVTLTEEMQAKGIQLKTAVAPSTFYMGFNMLDAVVGGDSERARKLRQAISIAVDYEEYITIFANGRGIPAMGPLPPGIFGYREGEAGINPVVYDWVDGAARRKPIEAAQRLLAEAGYPGGTDSATGAPLTLYLDSTARGPDDKARLDWLRKQFARLDINLVVRATDYNRFQEKIRKGNAQIFQWGWNADYPDPENFLFLLHGAQAKVEAQGENAANWKNPAFDRLFERMKAMDNGPERQALIDEMADIARRDAPWLWGLHPKEYGLAHGWVGNRKPNQIANNLLKYQRIHVAKRELQRAAWNRPVLWPLVAGALALAAVALPAVVSWRRRERRTERLAAAGEG